MITNHDELHQAIQSITVGIKIGFADGHPVIIYHVLNPKSQKICLAKEATFLSKSYSEW